MFCLIKCITFANMKKSTIWTIAIIMGLSFVVLLYLQLSYIEEMAKMKKEQFDETEVSIEPRETSKSMRHCAISRKT